MNGFGKYTCECARDFTGVNCERSKCIRYCQTVLQLASTALQAVLDVDYSYACLDVESVGLSVCLSVCWFILLMSRAKMVEPVDMPLGTQFHVGPNNPVLYGRHATWRIRLNDPCSAAVQAVDTVTVAACYVVNV